MKAIVDGDMILYASASNNVVQVVHNDEVICCQADPKDGFIQYMQRAERIAEDLNLNPEVDLMHCFTEKGMFRRDLAPSYKANRKTPKPMGYYAIKDKCTELPWAFMHEQVEADDLIGIFTTQFTELNEQCVIVSGDKDFIPALARIRQKGKRVALCSMRNCCSRDLLVPSTHCRDFDPIWLDDHLEYLIRPNANTLAPDAPLLTGSELLLQLGER